ncbi:phytanoyl-CoA dioxygenase family protein [Candidatus Poribacteria bacterium]|nr:phytanoyl-CoA dioxygenase family protein [Candidatus Poribacteria bacterium]
MTDQERYLFDLQGYLVIPEALSAEQLSALNAILDEYIARECAPDMTTKRFGGMLHWGDVYRDLIDNPSVVPYLEETLGSRFRLDHVYLDVIRSGKGPIGTILHGGGTPFDPSQYYRYADGRMYNGLSVVAYNLKTIHPGDGGFGCVPGSHKSNYRFPNEWRDLETLHPRVDCVTGPAGTAVLFTEALTHGTLPWRGADERRTVFFKYSPHAVSWSARYFDWQEFEGLTDRQKAILEGPNARYGGRPTDPLAERRG